MSTDRTLHVLVVTASRHGATREIGAAIAGALQEHAPGDRADVAAVACRVEDRPDPGRYDAVVLGSAVYVGRWLEPARQFATDHVAVLRRRPVWLFSSGPIGEPPFPVDDPHDAAPVAALLGARDHRVFPGRVDPALLGFGERAMVRAMRAPVGDWRDWPAVQAWGSEIARELTGVPTAQRTASPVARS